MEELATVDPENLRFRQGAINAYNDILNATWEEV
jgi:hypothetical protein